MAAALFRQGLVQLCAFGWTHAPYEKLKRAEVQALKTILTRLRKIDLSSYECSAKSLFLSSNSGADLPVIDNQSSTRSFPTPLSIISSL